MFQEPIVKRLVVLEFQCADRMRDALDSVRLAVREIVGWVDAPGVAGPGVRCMKDAI